MMVCVDIKGFGQFMEERNLVDEAHRSFYLRWVKRFLMAEFSANELADTDKVECFADQLARDSSVKEWQLRQALQAVSLYLDVYLPETSGREPGADDGAGETPAVRLGGGPDAGCFRAFLPGIGILSEPLIMW